MEKNRLRSLVPAAVGGIGVGLLLLSFGAPAHIAALVAAVVSALLGWTQFAALVAGAGATSLLVQATIWIRCEAESPTQPCMELGFARMLGMAVLITLISLGPILWTARTVRQRPAR